MEIQKCSGNSLLFSNDPSTSAQKKIKFNLDNRHLKCFMSDKKTSKMLNHQEKLHGFIKASNGSQQAKIRPLNFSLRIKNQSTPSKCETMENPVFHQKLLIISYDQEQFNGNNFINKSAISSFISSKPNQNKISHEAPMNQNVDDNIVAECLRVITEETDNTSNPSKDSKGYDYQNYSNLYSFYHNYPYAYYQQTSTNCETREESHNKPRNKKAFPSNECLLFQIDLQAVQKDGRTTLMLRNIPNKYTRDMILEEINGYKDFKKKYDFFYLPIDYRNQCNVGYAFINLIHTKFIQEFYEKFHMKKWQKFNSEKICQICYARIQGTAQLLNHFKDSNIIQQKDKKIRPIIDFKDNGIAEIVQRQKSQTNNFNLD